MRWQRGGRREDGVGVGVVGDGEGVVEDGGGDEEPSKLMEGRVGTSSLSTALCTVITLRLPDAAGGEGSCWRGGREGGSSSEALLAVSARATWCASARWLRRRRSPVGEDVEDILVLPPTVVIDKKAFSPAFSIL